MPQVPQPPTAPGAAGPLSDVRAPSAPPLAPPSHPTPSVVQRAGAVVDAACVRRRADAAVKHNTSPSRPGYPSTMTHWQTHLHVEAWVCNTTYAKHVWADLHVFGHDGALVASATIPFGYVRPAGDGGDLFELNQAIYEGATATPGSATPRPDVRVLQYRLYYQFDGRVLTDGVLHACTLQSDAMSH